MLKVLLNLHLRKLNPKIWDLYKFILFKLNSMHKDQNQQDFSSLSSSMISSNSLSKTSEKLTNKKRVRNKSSTNFSQKEEERILKFALKQSEKEYQQNQQKAASQALAHTSAFKHQSLPECLVIHATAEDFENPIAFIDGLWQLRGSEDTGLIKIIPPAQWREKQRLYFEEKLKSKINANDKLLTTRKQTLGLLYEAKVGAIF